MTRIASAVVTAAAVVLVGLPTFFLLFTFLSDVPYLGLAAYVVPVAVMWFVLLPILGGLAGLYRWRRRRDRLSVALVVTAAFAVVGATVIAGRMTAAVENAGGNISLIRAFGVGLKGSATPDAEVAYTTYEGEPLKLSIYRPSGSSRQSLAPVLVYTHGGGWTIGSRSDHSTDMRWFADQGWLTVSVDYTLSSEDRHLWDVTHGQIGCALAWVVENAQQNGGDPSRLSLTGDSAGGNLAINTAYMANLGTLPRLCGVQTPSVAAVAVLYPVVDPAGFHDHDDPALGGVARTMASSYTGGSPEEFPERYDTITSATYISGEAPPTLMIVGEADHLVPPEGAYRFAAQARSAGINVQLVRVPYADHVFDHGAGSIGQQAYRQLTDRWLRAHGQAP